MSPTLFCVKGYRFYFFSREETRMHVHVNCERGEAKIWMEPVLDLAYAHGIPQNCLNDIFAIVEERQNEIRNAWARYFGR